MPGAAERRYGAAGRSMPRRHPALILALALVLRATAHAALVGGGGSATTDCLLVFDAPVNTPARAPRNVRCTDGDACDADGVVNGACQLAVAACVNSTFDARCTLAGVRSVTVDHAVDDGDPRFDPQLQAFQTRIDSALELPTSEPDRCATATNFVVPVRGPLANGACRRGRKVVRVVAVSTAFDRDADRIKLTCDPSPAGCDARVLFSGTFDRIQRQIFNQSCAVSACHDSQSMQAELLLETGAAYGNLVGVVPTNAAAAATGWERVLAGDPERSFVYHKLTGDLPAGTGSPMPFGRPPLDASLVEVIRLWIAAGAPASGWVPGTD
jgi:hypothetical protein